MVRAMAGADAAAAAASADATTRERGERACEAARNGDADALKAILDESPEAARYECGSRPTADGGHVVYRYPRTPLRFAVRSGCCDAVRLLLDICPELAEVSVNDWMPLHEAAESGCADVVRLVLKAYPEAARHARRDYGTLPLHGAAAYGDAETVKLLVEVYPEAARHADNGDQIPLDFAVYNGFSPNTPRMTDDNDDDDSKDAHHDGPKRRLRDYVTTAKVLLDAYFPEEEGARHRVLRRMLWRYEEDVAEPRLRLMLALAWAGIRPSQAWSTDMASTMHGLTCGPWAQWEFVPLLRAHLSRIRAAMLVLYRRDVPLEVAQTVAGKLFALEMW